MKYVQDKSFTQYQLDPEACAFFIVNHGKPYIVFANMAENAELMLHDALREIGESVGDTSDRREIASFNHWPDTDILKRYNPKNIKTISVFPAGGETFVYILDRLPPAIIALLSAPLPSPEGRGVWPHGMRVKERRLEPSPA